MITKYGYDVFFTVAAVCVVIILLALLFIEPKSYRYSLIVVSLAVLGFAACSAYNRAIKMPCVGASRICACLRRY